MNTTFIPTHTGQFKFSFENENLDPDDHQVNDLVFQTFTEFTEPLQNYTLTSIIPNIYSLATFLTTKSLVIFKTPALWQIDDRIEPANYYYSYTSLSTFYAFATRVVGLGLGL